MLCDLQNSSKRTLKPLHHHEEASPAAPAPVIYIEDEPTGSGDPTNSETLPASNSAEVTKPEKVADTSHEPSAASTVPSESRRRPRLRTLSAKAFGRYQLEYSHWLHMAANRRRRIPKRPRVRRPVGDGFARRRSMEVGLPRRHRPIAARQMKFPHLESSDRPAIKSAGVALHRGAVGVSRAPQNVVDVDTVAGAVSSIDNRGMTDGVRTAIQMHFGAVSRIKAGAKCRIMARRWTTDDRLEYLVQWDAGIVTWNWSVLPRGMVDCDLKQVSDSAITRFSLVQKSHRSPLPTHFS